MSHHLRITGPGEGDRLFVVDSYATIKVAADDTDGTYELFELDAPQGSGAPMSRHPWAEAYYVVDGSITVQVGARTADLPAGGTITIPPNAPHAFTVTSGSAKILVVSLTPAGGRFFAELDEHVPPNGSFEEIGPKIAEVAERNEVTLLVGAPG